ncbi:MAG TPA: polyprenyl synthetase family protein [Candidatus Obscuribacterales bacterium]
MTSINRTAGCTSMTSEVQSQATFDFERYARAKRSLIEERLDVYLTPDRPGTLWDSMRYSVLSGGKRLRAILCLAAAEAMDLTLKERSLDIQDAVEVALPCACAIEMVHAMSLIHDDLPALDNDDLRRGKPTNHKVFGEAIALLAGDALLMLANQILIEETPRSVDSDSLLAVVSELAKATGPEGMVGGQVADLRFTGVGLNHCPSSNYEMLQRGLDIPAQISEEEEEEQKLDVKVLEEIHRLKTGALIRFAIWSGAKLVGANPNELSKLAEFGELLGLAFQIADDLLDVTGSAHTLGKTPGKDEAAQKPTWVRLFGMEQAREQLAQLETRGHALLLDSGLDEGGLPPLRALLQYAIHRSH